MPDYQWSLVSKLDLQSKKNAKQLRTQTTLDEVLHFVASIYITWLYQPEIPAPGDATPSGFTEQLHSLAHVHILSFRHVNAHRLKKSFRPGSGGAHL